MPFLLLIPDEGCCFSSVAYINILRTRIAQVFRIECAVRIQLFGIADANGISCVTYGHHGNPSGNILTKINNIGVGLYRFQWTCLVSHVGSKTASYEHAGCHLSAEHSLRDVGTLSLEPRGIVETNLAPALHLHAGIVFLTIVLVVGADRTVGAHLPSLVVGLQALRRAVLVLHDDVDAAFGKSEDRNLIGLVLLHGEQTTVAQDNAEAEAVGYWLLAVSC